MFLLRKRTIRGEVLPSPFNKASSSGTGIFLEALKETLIVSLEKLA